MFSGFSSSSFCSYGFRIKTTRKINTCLVYIYYIYYAFVTIFFNIELRFLLKLCHLLLELLLVIILFYKCFIYLDCIVLLLLLLLLYFLHLLFIFFSSNILRCPTRTFGLTRANGFSTFARAWRTSACAKVEIPFTGFISSDFV